MLARQQTRLCVLPPSPANAYIGVGGTTTTDEGESTFTGVAIGTPHPRRIVVLAVYHGVAAACSVTLNGIPSFFSVQNVAHEFSIHAFQEQMKTTGTVVITATGSIRKAFGVYAIYPRIHAPLGSGTASASTTNDAIIAGGVVPYVGGGGLAVYCGGQHATVGAFGTTWAGNGTVTEDADAQLEAAASYSWGNVQATRSAASALTLAETVSGTKRVVCASWGPP